MKKGYIEYVSANSIGFIKNPFNRILYINKDWPDGNWEKVSGPNRITWKAIKDKCKRGRSFTKEELLLELI